MSHALLALSSVGLGRVDEASAAIRNLESVGPRSFNVRLTALIAKLELALAHEQVDPIGEAATALLQLTEPPGEPTGIVWARQALALVAFKQRRWKEADSELTQAQSVLAKKAAPLAAWRLHRAAAQIYEAQSRLDEAKRARTRSAEVLKGIEDSLVGWDSLRHVLVQRESNRAGLIIWRSQLKHRLPPWGETGEPQRRCAAGCGAGHECGVRPPDDDRARPSFARTDRS